MSMNEAAQLVTALRDLNACTLNFAITTGLQAWAERRLISGTDLGELLV